MPKLSPWSELYLQAVKWADFAGNNRDLLAAAAKGWLERPGAVPFPDVDALAELAAAAAEAQRVDFPETKTRLRAAIALAKAEWDLFDAGAQQRQAEAERARFKRVDLPPLPDPREIFDPVKERIDL